jgi:hypothetical protein
MGVAFKDAAGQLREPGKVFEDIQRKFGELGEGAEKSRLLRMLMGGQSKGMVEFLNLGKEKIDALGDAAAAAGAVVTPAFEAMADAAHEAEVKLHWAWVGIQGAMAQKVTPAIIHALEMISDWIKDNPAVIGQALDVIRSATELAGKAFVYLAANGKELLEIIGAAGILRYGPGLVAMLKGIEIGSIAAAAKMITLTLALTAAIESMRAATALATGGDKGHENRNWGQIIGTVGLGALGGAIGFLTAGPAGVWPGIGIGAMIGGPEGARIGASYDPPEVKVTANLNQYGEHPDTTGRRVEREVGRAIGQSLRQQQAYEAQRRVREGI